MPEITESKYLITAGWDDVPHLSEDTKRKLLASTPVYLRGARSKGTPALGSGALFPISEETIRCDPFQIPKYWRQINGLDFGYGHPTAAVNLAIDMDSGIVYVTKCYKKSGADIAEINISPTATPAAAIKAWGEWIPTAWPHDGLQHDKGSGEELRGQYETQGLEMLPEKATHEEGGYGVEAGLMDMLDLMTSERFKVFSTCQEWFAEYRLYHREKGKVVKVFDDLMSATRYANMMKRFARSEVEAKPRLVKVPDWKQRIKRRASAQAA